MIHIRDFSIATHKIHWCETTKLGGSSYRIVSMSTSAEDDEIGPSIDAIDPEERIAARRLRIGKRLEQLRR